MDWRQHFNRNCLDVIYYSRNLIKSGLFFKDIEFINSDVNDDIYITGKKVSLKQMKKELRYTDRTLYYYQLFMIALYLRDADCNTTSAYIRNIYDSIDRKVLIVFIFWEPCASFVNIVETICTTMKMLFSDLFTTFISIYKDLMNIGTYKNLPFGTEKINYDGKYITKQFDDNDGFHINRFKNEVETYEYMKNKSNNYSLYSHNTNNKIYLIWDEELIPFNKVYHTNPQDNMTVLNVIKNMRKHKLYHGDLKSNNIMFNIITKEVQIIDLEHSKIVQGKNKITDDDVCLGYFDDLTTDYVYLTDELLYLYDLFKLVKSCYYTYDDMKDILIKSKDPFYQDYLILLYGHKSIVWRTYISDLKNYIFGTKFPFKMIERVIYLKKVVSQLNDIELHNEDGTLI